MATQDTQGPEHKYPASLGLEMTTLSSRCTATPARSHGLLLTNIQNPNPLPKGTSSRLPYVDASLPDGMDEATAEAQRRMAVNIRLREFYVQTINISSPGSDRPWQITPLGPEDRDLCDEGGLMVRHRDSVTLLRTKKHGRAFSMLALFGEDAVTQRAATPAPEGSVATPVAVHTRGTIVPREAHASVSSFVQDADRRQLAAALAPVPGPAPPYSSNEHLEEPQKGRSHWLVTFVLLASEMIGIVVAVMPWVFSRYGTWLGTIVIIAVQLISIAGSCALSKFCIQHPSCQDIFGVASLIFSRHRRGMILASFTFLSYLANAIAVMAFHVIGGHQFWSAMLQDTWSHHCSNILYGFLAATMCYLISLAPTLKYLSIVAACSLVSTIAALLVLCIGIVQQQNGTLVESQSIKRWPDLNDAFLTQISPFLNVSFGIMVQVTVPSLVRDMRQPEHFKYALGLSHLVVTVCYLSVGIIVYSYVGNANMTNPAINMLSEKAVRLGAWGLMLPTIVFLGSLYSAILAQSLIDFDWRGVSYLRNVASSLKPARFSCCHPRVLILLALWLMAFFIAQLVPFLESLTALVAAIFNSYFGFILPALVAIHLYKHSPPNGTDEEDSSQPEKQRFRMGEKARLSFWYSTLAIGVFVVFGVGVTASIVDLVTRFKTTGVERPWTCRAF